VAETLLGFDFGTRRIGVAVGNTLTGSARALCVIASEPVADRWAAIAALVAAWQPQRLVVGRPRHPDGAPLPLTARCERFARQLGGRFRRPVELIDESFSSIEARAGRARTALPEEGVERGRIRRAGEPVDDEAAAVILRQYLSSRCDQAPAR
jgi:putative Holliday junction resolvase